jgi:hypothetical protein
LVQGETQVMVHTISSHFKVTRSVRRSVVGVTGQLARIS